VAVAAIEGVGISVGRAFAPIRADNVGAGSFNVELMRRLPRVVLATLGLMLAYAAWPLHATWQIRDALITGDTPTLTRRIEWDALRASLKASLTPETLAGLDADPDAPPPSLWQRIKSAVAPSVTARAIDRFVTPEYLPVVLGYRRFWRGTIQPALGREEPQTALAGTLFAGSSIDRFVSFWKRLRRAVFHSPMRIEVEIEDKYRPGRFYTGMLELKGFQWKLTSLSIRGVGL
jgi:hypothetical protein